MTPTERALVAAIAAAPEDDAPRLVYADWLSEQGDPRGELVAVQCALHRGERDDAPESTLAPLRDRAAALLASHGEAWVEPLLAIAVGTYIFRRGLVERLDVLQPSIDGARLHEAAPLLREIRTSQLEDLLVYSASLPIEALTLFELPDAASVRRTCAAPQLASVRRLDLRFRNSDAELAQQSVVGPLALEHYGLHLRGAEPPVLLDEVLPRERATLQSLSLTGARMGDLRPLAHLPALQCLALDCPQLSIEQLASQPHPTVTSLSIRNRPMTLHDVELLLTAFPALQRLQLRACNLDDATAARLVAHPTARGLRRLDVGQNRLEAAGTRAIEELASRGALAIVDFTGNPHDPIASARVLEAQLARLS